MIHGRPANSGTLPPKPWIFQEDLLGISPEPAGIGKRGHEDENQMRWCFEQLTRIILLVTNEADGQGKLR